MYGTPSPPTTAPLPPKELNKLTPSYSTHVQSSACATFNILNQEDRRVVGALLAVDEEYPPAGGASP